MTAKSSCLHAGPQLWKEEPSTTDRSTDLYMLHEGKVGSITHAVDMNGSIRNEYDYDTFGTRTNVKTANSGSNQHFGYTGEMSDPESGLLYLRARYYDPSIGRFISADPYLGRMAEPVTQNRYIYVHNNPLLFVDPEGLSAFGGQVGFGPASYGLTFNPDTLELFFVNSTITHGADVGASISFSPLSTPKEGFKTSAFADITGFGKYKFKADPNSIKNALNNLGGSGDIGLIPGEAIEFDASFAYGAKLGAGLKEERTTHLFTFSNKAISDFLESCY